jgi:hypothetical protein
VQGGIIVGEGREKEGDKVMVYVDGLQIPT